MHGLAHIHGEVFGSVNADGPATISLGATAVIHGNVTAACVLVSGCVYGDIRASGTVVLHQTARVSGDIHCQRLSVAAGALVVGFLHQGVDGLTHMPQHVESAMVTEPPLARCDEALEAPSEADVHSPRVDAEETRAAPAPAAAAAAPSAPSPAAPTAPADIARTFLRQLG